MGRRAVKRWAVGWQAAERRAAERLVVGPCRNTTRRNTAAQTPAEGVMHNTQCMCLCGPAWAAQCAIRQLVNRGVVAGRRSFRATGREPGCVV